MPDQAEHSTSDVAEKAKVFCIGLGRTGTTSLTNALTLLGYRANHLPIDELTQREFHDYFAGNPHNSQPLKLSVLNEFDALADTPICCVYQGLDRAYLGSRFIVTVRDKQSWLASQERLNTQILIPFFSENPNAPDVRFLNFLMKTLITRTLGDESAGIFTDEFEGVAFWDPEVFARLYDAYYDQVRAYFEGREEQLLMLNIVAGEGWEKLAPFLGVTAPDEPFPFEMRLTRRETAVDAGPESHDDEARGRRIERIQHYLEAFQRHDLSACLGYFCDDAVVKFFDKRYEGRKAVEKWHRDRFAAKISLVNIGNFDSRDDTVTVDLTIASKFLRRWPIKGSGRAVISLDNDMIKEMGFEGVRLLR
jgi:hypothetical protein